MKDLISITFDRIHDRPRNEVDMKEKLFITTGDLDVISLIQMIKSNE